MIYLQYMILWLSIHTWYILLAQFAIRDLSFFVAISYMLC